jgi:hypothetical protein
MPFDDATPRPHDGDTIACQLDVHRAAPQYASQFSVASLRGARMIAGDSKYIGSLEEVLSMKILKRETRVASALVLGALTGPATADVFNPNFPAPITNPSTWGLNASGADGAGTSGSFAAAGMMGAKGWNNYSPPANWEDLIMNGDGMSGGTAGCTSMTAAHPTSGQVGFSLWPSECNPQGMAMTLNQAIFSPATWVVSKLPGPINPMTHVVDPSVPDPNKPFALDNVVNALRVHGSPAVIPMYGQADHWITVTQVTATQQPSHWAVSNIKYYDGGPLGGLQDSSGESYPSSAGVNSMNAVVFTNGYYSVITAINVLLDPVVNDPYYGQWVLLFEPPAGARPPAARTAAVKAPGVAQAMTARLAQHELWRSLVLAEVDKDPQIWSAITGGVAGPASLVHAVFPSGAPWNYYLVPILSKVNSHEAIAFVQLAADDGSFQNIHVPPGPVPFTPVDATSARNKANQMLSSHERLSEPVLTWDPRVDTLSNRSPTAPYYEFNVIGNDSSAKRSGVVRVRAHDGYGSRKL